MVVTGFYILGGEVKYKAVYRHKEEDSKTYWCKISLKGKDKKGAWICIVK